MCVFSVTYFYILGEKKNWDFIICIMYYCVTVLRNFGFVICGAIKYLLMFNLYFYVIY